MITTLIRALMPDCISLSMSNGRLLNVRPSLSLRVEFWILVVVQGGTLFIYSRRDATLQQLTIRRAQSRSVS